MDGGLRALGPDGLGQHEGGAAGCVNLPVVVHLQNFHVSLGEKANGVLYQAAQNLDDMNLRLKKVPRIYMELYEYGCAPSQRSLDFLERKYLK